MVTFPRLCLTVSKEKPQFGDVVLGHLPFNSQLKSQGHLKHSTFVGNEAENANSISFFGEKGT